MSPKTPYYAVIFTARRTTEEDELYESTGKNIFELALKQPGFLGYEGAGGSDRQEITVTYWDSLENIKRWKMNADHVVAQKMGRDKFYEEYHVRVTKVEREYHWTKANSQVGDEKET